MKQSRQAIGVLQNSCSEKSKISKIVCKVGKKTPAVEFYFQ